jgi:hypothetical protein
VWAQCVCSDIRAGVWPVQEQPRSGGAFEAKIIEYLCGTSWVHRWVIRVVAVFNDKASVVGDYVL